MVVLALHGGVAVEIKNQQPAGVAQYPVGFACDAKQILAIAQIQAEPEYDDLKRGVFERQSFCGAATGCNAARFRRIHGRGRRIDAIAVKAAVFFEPAEPRPIAAADFEHLRSLLAMPGGQLQYLAQERIGLRSHLSIGRRDIAPKPCVTLRF